MKNLPENPFEKLSHPDPLIFLLRHGRIKDHETKRFIGATDVELDPMGIDQALYWKKAFSSLNFEAVHSSSLQRCTRTAELIANDKKIITSPALNEIHMGKWDGCSFDQIKQQSAKEFEKRGKNLDTYKTPGGESFHDTSCRAVPYFKDCATTLKNNILFVTHAGVIRVILCHLLGIKLADLFQIKISYAQLFVIQPDLPS